MGRSSWSVEARALVRPASVYRDLARREGDRPAALRRTLLLLLISGCFVSAVVSGRFSVRLIVDGAVSFAFIPIVEVAALGAVALTGARRRVPWARSVAVFFVGHAPWLVWITLVMVLVAAVPPRLVASLTAPFLLASAVVALWSARLDYHFFREVMDRSQRGAVGDVILYRAMVWSLGIAYFFGIAIWSETVPDLMTWVGV